MVEIKARQIPSEPPCYLVPKQMYDSTWSIWGSAVMTRTVSVGDFAATAVVRTAWLLTWTWIVLAHVAAAVLALGLLWFHQVQPKTLLSSAAHYLTDQRLQALGAIGITGLLVLGAYAWLVRQVAIRIDSRLRRYLSGLG